LIVEQSDADVPLADARTYAFSAPQLLRNHLNASDVLCDSDWDDARAHTLLTILVRVSGSERHGTYAIVGAKADHPPANVEILEDVDIVAARKRAFALASTDVGSKLRVLRGPERWRDVAP